MLEIQTAAASNRGGRTANEDAFRIGRAGARHCAVLADGAGGHAGGAEASRRVVEHVDTALAVGHAAFTPQSLTRVLVDAHTALQRHQFGASGRHRMHTTVVVLWVDALCERSIWSHVGDSRLYRMRYGAVDLVTTDDSVVQRMLESGLLTPRQAETHPMKNQLLAAVGMQESVEPHTPVDLVQLEDGDAFLLCTDGWWSTLTEAEMVATLATADTPAHWLEAMQALIEARAASNQDNFSAIALWADDPEQSTLSMQEGDQPVIAGL